MTNFFSKIIHLFDFIKNVVPPISSFLFSNYYNLYQMNAICARSFKRIASFHFLHSFALGDKDYSPCLLEIQPNVQSSRQHEELYTIKGAFIL